MSNAKASSLEVENCWLKEINRLLGSLVENLGVRPALKTDRERIYGDPKYSYFCFDPTIFLRSLIAVRMRLKREGFVRPYANGKAQPKFLDVGCGVGDKIVLASGLDFDAYGIEINPYLIRYAKRIFGITDSDKKSTTHIIQQDAMSHQYDGYHVIFLDAPFQDKEKEFELERTIYKQMDLGAFLLMPKYVAIPPKSDFIVSKKQGSQSLLIFRKVRKDGKKFVENSK